MSTRQPGRKPYFRLNLKLDYELDADLIDWITTQPPGQRSQAVREGLRRGINETVYAGESSADTETLHRIVAEELARALVTLQDISPRSPDSEPTLDRKSTRLNSSH